MLCDWWCRFVSTSKEKTCGPAFGGHHIAWNGRWNDPVFQAAIEEHKRICPDWQVDDEAD